MADTAVRNLWPGPAAFYGVRPAWWHLWRQAREWFYLDNAWFDAGRERFFRVGVNAMQTWSRKPSDGKRLKALGVQIRPQRRGRHIVVCRQSDEFMAFNAEWPGGALGWQQSVLTELKQHTDRPMVVRAKHSTLPLQADLKDACALVAHSSAAAVEALIAGVPVIVTDPNCAAAEFAMKFSDIESPPTLIGVEAWAQRLADSQWTLDEMREGAAWREIAQRLVQD